MVENTGQEIANTQSMSLKSEASNVDFIKIGMNPAVMIVFIWLLLYLLWKAHWNNKPKF